MNHKFQINLRGIIDLLSEHLYSGPEVYIRELLQNAVDAITARTKGEKNAPAGEITLELHSPKGKPPTIVFSDNGVGLTEEEVHAFLATIGSSSKKKTDPLKPSDFIGQFGIGILSCFVVSEEIVVTSRSAKNGDAKAIEWRAKPDGTYALKSLDVDREPGTQVWLTAKPGAEEHFAMDRVRELCKRFGGLLPIPIRIQHAHASEIVNAGGPPWRQPFKNDKARGKSLLEFGHEQFGAAFFDAIPLKTKVGEVDGVAFVLPFSPGLASRRQHRVYLKNMFLSDKAENLLPDWAFFVQAVVNANDLRPTASRESFYEDAKLKKVREALGDSLRQYLVDLAEGRPEKLEQFVSLHHLSFKALAAEDAEFFRIVIDHIPFETTLGRMPFGEYRRRFSDVKFVQDVESFRQIQRVAAAQNQCIINAGYTYDVDLMARAAEEFDELSVQAVDPKSLSEGFQELTVQEEEDAQAFLAMAESILKPLQCGVEARKFKPGELPAMYSIDREGRFRRSLEQTTEVANPLWGGVLDTFRKADKIAAAGAQLCLNFANPMIQSLAGETRRARLAPAIRLIYVQALLLGHHPLSSKEMTLFSDSLQLLLLAE